MKDINGNEFKVRCVFDSPDTMTREVLKVLDHSVLYYNEECDSTGEYTDRLDKCCILHYRELAPDKNGFMLCEGDTVEECWFKGANRVITFINGFFLLEDPSDPSIMAWENPSRITFVSRPTDQPKNKLEQLIKEAEEAKQRLDEALRKAKA